MFSYCGNNPLSRRDDGGNFWNVVIGAAVGAIVNGVTTAIDTYMSTGSVDWKQVAVASAVGAFSGGIAATGLGVIAQASATAAASAVGSVISDVISRQQSGKGGRIIGKKAGKIAVRAVKSAAIGFGSSVLGSAAGKVLSDKMAEKGAEIVLRGKGGVGCWTRAQARNMVNRGESLINTARGVSSVIGTFFTWPTATALSQGLS